jgi:excisionase family DNA binding protein
MRHQSARPAPSTATHLHAGQVAALLGVAPNTIARWSRHGRLPHQRTLGGHRRSPHPAIRALATHLAQEVSR